MENNMISFLKRAAERTGFQREHYLEKDIPTVSSNIEVLPFFGDLRSIFLLSSFLLRPYQETKRKYLVLCSWPGYQHLFPYVNEYWSLKDSLAVKTLVSSANNLYNVSDVATSITRTLIQHFENVTTSEDLKQYYDNGFTQRFWREFGQIRRYLPDVSSATRINPDLQGELTRKGGKKVVIFPVTKMRSWQRGRLDYLPIQKDFWTYLLERMLAEGWIPVVYQGHQTYDMSPDFGDRCIYLVTKDISQVLCAMRSIGCVLDIHSGISRLAIAARCPFVAVDERPRFVGHKEYEIDDLCCDGIPKQYIFNFSSMIMTGDRQTWDTNIVDNIMTKLEAFLPTLNREEWMSPNESYDLVSYDKVRERNAKRLGVHFIKVKR